MPNNQIVILPTGTTSEPMNGSLLITFNGQNYNNIEIFVNNVLTNHQFTAIDGFYATKINPNDVITIVESGAWDINIIRRDYITDDVNGNNGITDTLITATTTSNSYTFTATTVSADYNFEYRVTITNFGPTPTPTPTPCPTYTVVQSGLTLHVDFENINSYSGGTKVYDLTSSDTGSLSGVTYLSFQFPYPCRKYMVLGDNNGIGNMIFPTSSYNDLTGSVAFSMGGWVADDILRDADFLYSFGFSDTRLSTDFYARPSFSIQTGPFSRIRLTGTTQAYYKTFNHIFGTNSASEMKLYLNGQLLYQRPGAGTINFPGLGFASGRNSPDYLTQNGLPAINDFTVYNRTLTATEVLSNYNIKKNSFGYSPLPSGITIQWEYNWSGGTAGNINLENMFFNVGSGYFPLEEGIQSLGAVGGSITGSMVTYQSYLTGETFNGNRVRIGVENCRNGNPTAQRIEPNNCSLYKNNVLLYTRNRTGAQFIGSCPVPTIIGPNDYFIYQMDSAVNYSFSDGDVIKIVVNNYFIPDATPTPTPTNTPTPTPTATQTPTPTPIPPTGITLSGLTIYTDGSPSSYPGTGTTWTSIVTGTTYNGTLIGGPVWSGGTPPYFQFDGVDDYVSYPYTGSSTGSFTWGGWINIPTGFTAETLYMRGRDGSGSGWSLQLSKKDTNLLQASVVSSGFTTANAEGITYITTNTWYYVIGVWNPGSSIKLYLNGVLEKTTNTTITTLRSSNTGWIIARGNGTEYTQAKISNFALYERVLSDAEILTNFNNTKSNYGY